MALNLGQAYCSDVSIAYTIYEDKQNLFCLSGLMTVTCVNPNKAPNAMSVLVGLQNQSGIRYRVGEDNRIHCQIAQGIDVEMLVISLMEALEVVGCSASIFDNT